MDAVSYSHSAKQAQRIEKFIKNPDSSSGIVTVPKVIGAGENITIPAGRVAVLPNVQVDGTLNVEGDVFIPSGATFGDLESQIALKADTSYVNNKYSGFKNYIINGNFDIWQRGISQTVAGYGSDDRWNNDNVGSTKLHSQIVCTDTERALFNASYFSRTVVTSVAGSNNYCIKVHRIEDVTKTAGKTVTLSFWAKADSNKNIAIGLFRGFGSGGTPSPTGNGIGTQKIALTTNWKKFSLVFNIPSIIGKTLGTDGVHTSYLGLYFWFDAGSNFNYRTDSLGQQSGTFDIAQVQLEEGSVATPFEQRPYGLELSLCQRYYEAFRYQMLGTPTGAGQYFSCPIVYNTAKRTIPTLINTPEYNTLATSFTFYINKPDGGSLYVLSSGAGVLDYRGYVSASAEL